MNRKKEKWKLFPVAVGVASILGSASLSAKAPLIATTDESVIEREYIVALKQDTVMAASFTAQSFVQSVAQDVSTNVGLTVDREYSNVMLGMAVTASPTQIEQLRNNPLVDYVEANRRVTINATQHNPPSWGLDRVDQTHLPMDDEYQYTNDGTGVHVYILDTGIYANHPDFSGRIGNGTDKIDNDSNPADCNGHGTHVAGTAAGTTYGVAKGATLHAVRVLDCQGSGSFAGIIDGMDWVVANAQMPAVVNMSLGGGASSSVDAGTNRLIDAGVTVVAAAGNDGADACGYSPARTPNAITVAASDSSDRRVNSGWSSNYGSCVDIFAPGLNIVSASHTSSGSKTMGGTSMSSPHVAGGVALYLQSNPDKTPAEVTQAILSDATSGVISNVAGSPNLLLKVNGASPPPVVVELENGVPETGISGSSKEQLFYIMNVEPGASGLTFNTEGGTGDADLYVKFGSKPSLNDYDCKSTSESNTELCDFNTAQVGTYHIMVEAWSAISGVSLTGSYYTDTPDLTLENGVPEENLSASKGTDKLYTFEVPVDSTDIMVDMSGGTGDADLYVKFGSVPTESDYDCRPYAQGNNESCEGTQSDGTYFVLVKAFSDYSGVTLLGSYTPPPGDAVLIDRTEPISTINYNQWAHFTETLTPGYATLNVTLTGGTGDADLYIRHGSQSTFQQYDCRPYLDGNEEFCTIDLPSSGTWYFDVYGYGKNGSSNLSLNINAIPQE